MALIDLFRQPWFQVPICPYTLVYWSILAVWGGRKLLQSGATYKRRRVGAWITALFILGFIYLIIDSIWIIINNVRWFSEYPQMVLNYLLFIPRNLAGMFFLYVFVEEEYKVHWKFTKKTFWTFISITLFIVFLFLFAPNFGLTNWAYAAQNNYSEVAVYLSFFLSHVCLKILIAFAYTTLFKPQVEVMER